MLEFIGLRIVSLRKKKKISGMDFAKGLVSTSYLSNIEHCRKTPSVETLVDFAHRLSIDESQLVVDEQNIHREELREIYAKIFNCLISDLLEKAEQLLDKVEKEYVLAKELPEDEVTFFVLKALFFLKQWCFEDKKEIEAEYLAYLKGVNLERLPSHLQIYYLFYQGLNENYTPNYQTSVKHFTKIENSLAASEEVKLCANVAMAVNYTCLCQYECVIETIERGLKRADRVDSSFRPKVIQLYYLAGFSYFYTGFYKRAKQNFLIASNLLEVYPSMNDNYGILLLYWKKQASVYLKEKEEIILDNQRMFTAILEKYDGNEEINKNDYLPMSEILVDYSEEGELEKAAQLGSFFEKLVQLPKELEMYIHYSEALIAYHNKALEQAEKLFQKLLEVVDESNNPMFIIRVKRFAGKFYAERKKYKRSFEILNELE